MTEPSEVEIAWAAGIFEGEGTAVISGRSHFVAVEMADLDVITRLNRIFPAAAGVRLVPREGKDLYKWMRCNGDDVREFYEYVYILLAKRRKRQALRILAGLDERPGKKWREDLTHCKRGHRFTIANTRIVKGGRACKTCELVGKRRRRALQRGNQ